MIETRIIQSLKDHWSVNLTPTPYQKQKATKGLDWVYSMADLLRKEQTRAEKRLWEKLRSNKLGIRFHRQKVVCGYIADFCCPKRRLVIEVDGSSHKDRKDRDAIRDVVMKSRGYKVIRFRNSDIMQDLNYVIKTIAEFIR